MWHYNDLIQTGYEFVIPAYGLLPEILKITGKGLIQILNFLFSIRLEGCSKNE